MGGQLKTQEESTLPNRIKNTENNIENVKKQIKNLEEQNDLAVNNMPENDEDFIEYDLDLKEKMQF